MVPQSVQDDNSLLKPSGQFPAMFGDKDEAPSEEDVNDQEPTLPSRSFGPSRKPSSQAPSSPVNTSGRTTVPNSRPPSMIGRVFNDRPQHRRGLTALQAEKSRFICSWEARQRVAFRPLPPGQMRFSIIRRKLNPSTRLMYAKAVKKLVGDIQNESSRSRRNWRAKKVGPEVFSIPCIYLLVQPSSHAIALCALTVHIVCVRSFWNRLLSILH